ncbi:hypothetical protein PMAYCL1PPCAC_11088, partial [Pristionchus mayeri]
ETSRKNKIATMEEESPMDSEDWMREPASYHTMIFTNGKRLQMEFYFEKNKLTFDDYTPVNELDQFCLYFTSITSHPDYSPNIPTPFRIIFEDLQIAVRYLFTRQMMNEFQKFT